MTKSTMTTWFDRVARTISHALGTPQGFMGFWGIAGIWFVAGWFKDWSEAWLIAFTLFLSIMTQATAQLIRYAEEANSIALQKKLDELIRAIPGARDELMGIEEPPCPE